MLIYLCNNKLTTESSRHRLDSREIKKTLSLIYKAQGEYPYPCYHLNSGKASRSLYD